MLFRYLIICLVTFFAACEKAPDSIEEFDSDSSLQQEQASELLIPQARIEDECYISLGGQFNTTLLNGRSIDRIGFLISPYNLPEHLFVAENAGSGGIYSHPAVYYFPTAPGDSLGNINSSLLKLRYTGLTYFIKCFIVFEISNEHIYSNTISISMETPLGNGPAGGFVFYDKGNYSDGWRYLEASPINITELSEDYRHEIGLFKWSNTINPTIQIPDNIYNSGMLSTQYLLENCPTCIAIELCNSFEYNGYSDWFLPSALELGYLKSFIQNQNPDFPCENKIEDFYWSSTQSGQTIISPQMLGSGFGSNHSINSSLHVRPIRQF